MLDNDLGQVVVRMYDALNRSDRTALNEIFAEEFGYESPPTGRVRSAPGRVGDVIDLIKRAVPNFQYEVLDVVPMEHERVRVRWSASGTVLPERRLAPGRHGGRIAGESTFAILNGRISDQVDLPGYADIAPQLGAELAGDPGTLIKIVR